MKVIKGGKSDVSASANENKVGPVTPILLTADDVREFFAVEHAEIEPDGSIWVAYPVQAYSLSREEILSCLRHMSARRGVILCHDVPAHRLLGRPVDRYQ